MKSRLCNKTHYIRHMRYVGKTRGVQGRFYEQKRTSGPQDEIVHGNCETDGADSFERNNNASDSNEKDDMEQ